MRYFSLFSGVGGFEIGINNAYGLRDSSGDRGGAKTERELSAEAKSPAGENSTGNIDHRESAPVVSATCLGFSEIDTHASAVLRYRFPNIPNHGDITKIDWSTVPDFDLLVGGSPCQSFSVAGKRKGLEGQSGLFMEYLRCLQEKKPEYFIWENVRGVLSSGSGADFAFILNSFSEAGYSLSWQVLNAKDFGVPQNRERVFVIGTRGDSGREVFFEARVAGEVTGSTKTARPVLTPERIVKRQNGRRFKENGEPSFTLNAIDRHGVLVKEATKKGYAIAEEGDSVNFAVPGSATRRGRVGKGIANTLDTSCEQGVIARTVRTGGKGSPHGSKQDWDSYEVEGRIRRLTPKECMRLMSWPDDHCDFGDYGDGVPVPISNSQKYKMAGNGVVSKVVEAIVREYLI